MEVPPPPPPPPAPPAGENPEQPPKRKRGRPRKIQVGEPKPKRPRGRPRKIPLAQDPRLQQTGENVTTAEGTASSLSTTAGGPVRAQLPTAPGQAPLKRPRGRPRKTEQIDPLTGLPVPQPAKRKAKSDSPTGGDSSLTPKRPKAQPRRNPPGTNASPLQYGQQPGAVGLISESQPPHPPSLVPQESAESRFDLLPSVPPSIPQTEDLDARAASFMMQSDTPFAMFHHPHAPPSQQQQQPQQQPAHFSPSLTHPSHAYISPNIPHASLSEPGRSLHRSSGSPHSSPLRHLAPRPIVQMRPSQSQLQMMSESQAERDFLASLPSTGIDTAAQSSSLTLGQSQHHQQQPHQHSPQQQQQQQQHQPLHEHSNPELMSQQSMFDSLMGTWTRFNR